MPQVTVEVSGAYDVRILREVFAKVVKVNSRGKGKGMLLSPDEVRVMAYALGNADITMAR